MVSKVRNKPLKTHENPISVQSKYSPETKKVTHLHLHNSVQCDKF